MWKTFEQNLELNYSIAEMKGISYYFSLSINHAEWNKCEGWQNLKNHLDLNPTQME